MLHLGRNKRQRRAVGTRAFDVLHRQTAWQRSAELVSSPRLQDFPSGSETDDAARMNQVLEDGVRAVPEQHLWTFKLLKTRSAGELSAYH